MRLNHPCYKLSATERRIQTLTSQESTTSRWIRGWWTGKHCRRESPSIRRTGKPVGLQGGTGQLAGTRHRGWNMGNGPQQTRIGSVTWCAITLAATLAIFIADATKTRPEIVTTWKLLAWAFAFAATVWLWGQTARSLLPIGRAQEGQRLWKRGIAEIVWLAPAYMVLSTLAPPLFAAMVLSAANLVRIWAWNIHTRRKPPSPPGPRAWPDFEAAFVARGLSRVFPVCMLTGAALSLLLVEKMRRDDFDQALLLGMIAAGGSAIAVFFDLLPNEVLLRWRRLALPLAATALLLYLLTPSKQLMPGVAQAARLPDFVRLQAASNAAPPVGIGRGAFPGVILRPRFHEKLSKTIVAPAAILGAASSESLGISFAGEYWFFRTPDTAPPRAFDCQGVGSNSNYPAHHRRRAVDYGGAPTVRSRSRSDAIPSSRGSCRRSGSEFGECIGRGAVDRFGFRHKRRFGTAGDPGVGQSLLAEVAVCDSQAGIARPSRRSHARVSPGQAMGGPQFAACGGVNRVRPLIIRPTQSVTRSEDTAPDSPSTLAA